MGVDKSPPDKGAGGLGTLSLTSRSLVGGLAPPNASAPLDKRTCIGGVIVDSNNKETLKVVGTLRVP